MKHVVSCGLRPRAFKLPLAALLAVILAGLLAGQARAVGVPPVVTVTQAPPVRTTDTSAIFAFVSSAVGSSFQCRLDTSPFSACSSPKTYGGLTAGNHVFTVKATDPMGNTSADQTVNWLIESVDPAIPAVPAAGTIDTSGPLMVTFTGTVTGTIPDGETCGDLIATGECGYFELETNDAGVVEVSIRWPVAADPLAESNLDLYIFRCNPPSRDPITGTPTNPQAGPCTQVAFAATDRGNFEGLNFSAVAGAVYEIRVVPFFVLIAETYDGCAGYDNGDPNTDACGNPIPAGNPPPPPPPPPNGDPAVNFFAGCSSGPTSAQVKGGGFVAAVDGALKGNFSLNAFITTGRNVTGRLDFKDDATKMRLLSDGMTCSGSGSYLADAPGVEIRGAGKLTQSVGGQSTSRRVCYQATAVAVGGMQAFGLVIRELTSNGGCNIVAAPTYEKAASPVLGGFMRQL